MAVERVHVGWKFWFPWVAANTMSFIAILIVPFFVEILASSIFPSPNTGLGVALATTTGGALVVGVLFGIIQGQILGWQRQVGWAFWVVANIMGMVAGNVAGWISLAVLAVFPEASLSTLSMILILAMAGAITGAVGGALQGLVLFARYRQILWATGWGLVSVVGWILSLSAVPIVFDLTNFFAFTSFSSRTLMNATMADIYFIPIALGEALVVALVGGGIVHGIAVGTVQVWLLRRQIIPRQRPVSLPVVEPLADKEEGSQAPAIPSTPGCQVILGVLVMACLVIPIVGMLLCNLSMLVSRIIVTGTWPT